MKKFRLAVSAAVVMATIALTGCGGLSESGKTAYEKINETLVSMKSFEADATVTYISNKTNHTYSTKQQCKTSGEYRIEVTGPEKAAGNITVFDGKQIYQYNTRVAGKMNVTSNEASERLELFLTSFVKNYVKSNEVSVAAAKLDESMCTVLEAVIPGEHPFLKTEKLWVDNNTRIPAKLVIYDANGSERIVVEYEKFNYNVDLPENLFKIE
ncbi:MAG: hypothetical protein LBM16_00030 [Clostridiales bacterium]|jgi:outer membrane lipoprotein-sorting protein|nr:hypothetical protein [Clostridiales bacterium]